MGKTVENGRQEESEGENATGKKPFFSIIIPVYNVAPYLRECLDSVLAQTFPDWEAICVDDGSTDESGAILDEYAAKDERFRVIHKKNEGVSVARNAALDAARGNYVVFVDADDVILRDWLNVFQAVIAQDGCEVVRARLQHWHGEPDYKDAPELKYSIVARHTSRSAVCTWGVPEVLYDGYSWLNCVKRELIYGLKFPIGIRVLEDCIFSAQIMAKATSVSEVDYAGYLYRARPESACRSQGTNELFVMDRYRLFKALANFWRERCQAAMDSAYLPPIRLAVTTFAFRHTFSVIAATRRHLENPSREYRRLAEALHELDTLGAFDMSALVWSERIAFIIYVRTFAWRSMLLLWMFRAARSKIAKLFSKE